MNFLSGYKTYITAAIAVLSAIEGFAVGTSTLPEAMQLGFTGGLAAMLRLGMK
jgi:hypothetical protein